jgi:hypothetical protein
MKHEEGLSARIYLFLLRTGGRWRYQEIMDATGNDSFHEVWKALTEMARLGRVKKYTNGKRGRAAHVEFGVTEDCLIPRTVRIRDLRESLVCEDFVLETST